jgi:hypothetical protein
MDTKLKHLTPQQQGEIILAFHRAKDQYAFERGLWLARFMVGAGAACVVGFILWSIAL